MAVDVLLGLQWGDEGKGKIVDYLANNYDIVARFQGGPNAGHTLKFGGYKFVLHTVPSGIFRENLINLIGNGVVIDPVILEKEIKKLDELKVNYNERLFVSRKAHLILPTHRLLDAASEAAKGKEKIGSTLKGIGPTYMDKTGRNGIRVGDILQDDFLNKYHTLKKKHLGLAALYPAIDFDLDGEEQQWFASLELLKSLQQVDGEYFINQALQEGKRILAEGAQGSMLDIDFGTYPFVTSSNTISAGVCNGLGIAPNKIGEVIGITKAYCTRVGAGPFPTELKDETGAFLRKEGAEFGATTGRPRRCGWIDLPQLRYTIMLNGVTQLVVTKIDVFNKFSEIAFATKYLYEGKESKQIPFDMNGVAIHPIYQKHKAWNVSLEGIRDYQKLPENVKSYIAILEKELGVPVKIISTGPDRTELILKEE